MSELSDQVEAHKARRQRFELAATRYKSERNARCYIEQSGMLEECIPLPKKMLPPIPNAVIAGACKIAFPPIIVNQIEAIQRAVLREYPGLTMADMKSSRRTAQIVNARQIAMYLAKKITSRSLPDIGRRFGGRDHTTVLHAVRKIEAKAKKDPILSAEIERIKENIPEIRI